MDIKDVDITTHADGKAGFIVELTKQINLPAVFNRSLTKTGGRPAEISYGVLAQMMIVNMCDKHHPLSRLAEYYEHKDLEGLFHEQIKIEQINDDRFGGFLDAMYEYGAKKLFTEIATNAFMRYGIRVKTINFDTTSKVMWGSYEGSDGKEGEISITFGHSKQKRNDKKQIKIGVGTAEGIVVVGEVLSGNIDDKTYNKEKLDEVEEILDNFKISKEDFHYIADSSLFTEENLKKAQNKNIKIITRMVDTTTISKDMKKEIATKLEDLEEITFQREKKNATYKIVERVGNYRGIPLKYAICYSYSLEKTKERTQGKQKDKEFESLLKLSKSYKKSSFACLEDAQKEIVLLEKRELKKIKFHNVDLTIEEKEKTKRGRPAKSSKEVEVDLEYKIIFDIEFDEKEFDQKLKESCLFILCSTDLTLSAEEILREYKTQDSVEKKFKQLKSPQFVNSLFLESVTRVEALAYLMLITLMVLSVAEYVVRRGLKEDDDFIIGPGKIKMKRPTLNAIYQIFYTVQTIRIIAKTETIRRYTKPLEENIKKIFKYLGIHEDALITQCK